MASDQKRRSHTVEQGPAPSSNGAKNLPSSDAACLNAALALYKEIERTEFLKLAQDVTGRHLATPRGREGNEKAAAAMKTIRNLFDTKGHFMDYRGAEKAVDAYKTLWPDDSFTKLDDEVFITLANSTTDTKSLIPSWHFRAFIGAFSELAERYSAYRIDEHGYSDFSDEVDEMIKDAFNMAKAVLGSRRDSESRLLGAGEYKHGKKLSSRIMEQIKLISDSITADADKIIESEKHAFQGLESLVGQLCESPQPQGNDTSNVFREICKISMSQSCESLETLKAKVQAMSKFLEGSIEILQDSSDSSN